MSSGALLPCSCVLAFPPMNTSDAPLYQAAWPVPGDVGHEAAAAYDDSGEDYALWLRLIRMRLDDGSMAVESPGAVEWFSARIFPPAVATPSEK